MQVKQTVQDLKSRIDKLRAEQNAELQARCSHGSGWLLRRDPQRAHAQAIPALILCVLSHRFAAITAEHLHAAQ